MANKIDKINPKQPKFSDMKSPREKLRILLDKLLKRKK